MLKRFQRGLLFVIGFLLSPLCWWNDLLINLPIAYGFGRVFSWFSEDLLIPAAIVGYWLSNIIGILLMQFGAMGFLPESSSEKNWKKQTFMGLLSSTVLTVIIVILWQTNLFDFSYLSFLTIFYE
ncbi:conserved hypothetical protein [Rippkaea orientalis PCC 8801]|uniref:Uncharacterized protein n=1 Tax=Rippkaea orientalis (strain PCC 8801 / RF-1) TaxID=41431 RepID=B7JVI7_RIPO1|nr:hypothetical protein [Rippkaea orientalis]ACK68320.1 conserved hypothetical protein [Rippkaea orientalis PCC 8801]